MQILGRTLGDLDCCFSPKSERSKRFFFVEGSTSSLDIKLAVQHSLTIPPISMQRKEYLNFLVVNTVNMCL